MKEGPGRCIWKDGDVFEGNYSNDLPEGVGSFKSKTKEQSGYVKSGFFHG